MPITSMRLLNDDYVALTVTGAPQRAAMIMIPIYPGLHMHIENARASGNLAGRPSEASAWRMRLLRRSTRVESGEVDGAVLAELRRAYRTTLSLLSLLVHADVVRPGLASGHGRVTRRGAAVRSGCA
jgi:hypothetical protein